MLVISASFTILLSACVPAVSGLQTWTDHAVDTMADVTVQGIPRIGTFHVYDLNYDRPTGLSYEDAGRRGLLVGNGPTAWESADYDHGTFNTGNLVWSLGARMLLGNSSELIMGPEKWSKDKSLSAIFLATGPVLGGGIETTRPIKNQSTTQLESKAKDPIVFDDAIYMVEKPTVIVGMGIGEYDGDRPNGDHSFKCMDVLLEERKRPLDRLQARINHLGGFVGLRGKCSESVIRRYGYSGFEAMGCPSLFINTNRGLGNILQSKFNALPFKAHTDLEVAVAMPSTYDKAVVPFLAKVLHFFPKSFLINQNEGADALFERGCHDLGLEKPARKSFLYYDALEWRQKISQVDLVVSARIHGSMIAIAAQTPAVVIPVDMRVLEMVEAMQLPHILPAELPDGVGEFVVKGVSKFDGRAFDQQRRAYAARYKELFSKVGLTLNPELSYL